MLINFCDSSFSIGESHSDKRLRYLKQIKQRNTEQIYDADNVCVCQIDKPFNFLQFEYLNLGREWEHLKQHTEKDKEDLTEKVRALKKQGGSLRTIGGALGISHQSVKRILETINDL
jgi:DNA-binding transcriptional regulator LsrR (DeoR family)